MTSDRIKTSFRDVGELVRQVRPSSPTHPCYDCGTSVQSCSAVVCSYCFRPVCDSCYWYHAAGECLTRVGASHKE